MLDILGWIGAMSFLLCGLPQALDCYHKGNGDGLAHGFLWLWFIGECCMTPFTILSNAPLPLIANYAFNAVILLVIMRYKYLPRSAP